MSVELIGVIAFVVACVLLAAFVLYRKYQYNNAWKEFPTWWAMKGEAPPMTGVALDIIKESTPGMKYYGTIEWVKGPFTDGMSPRLLAGLVVSFYPPYLKVMYDDKVERTALAHEIRHVWDAQRGQPYSEPVSNPEYSKWLYDVNNKILKAVGR